MKHAKFKKGERVLITVNNVQPEYVGQIGRIAQVRDADVEQPVYKVHVKGVMLRLWATEDCLQAVEQQEADDEQVPSP